MDNDFNNKLSFGSDGGSSSFTVSVTGDCEGDKTITYTTEDNLTDWANITYTNNTFTVVCKGKNETTSKYTGALILKIGDDTCTSDKINCEQAAVSCLEDSCTCYLVGAVSYPSSSDTQATVSWPYSAITWTTASTCDITSALTTTNTSSTTVTYDPANCNKWEQSGTTTWTGYKKCENKSCSSSDATISWSVNQGRPAWCECNCSTDLHVSGTKNIGSNKQETATEVGTYSISTNCTESMSINSVSVTEGGNWLTLTSNNSTPIMATWTENESMTDTRTAVIAIKANLNGEACPSEKTIEVVQAKKDIGCACADLKVITIEGEEIPWMADKYLTSLDEEFTFTYKFKEGQEACFEDAVVEFDYAEEDEQLFEISTSTIDGKSYINIKPKPEGEHNQIDIYFKYKLTNGTDCGDNYITVHYEPACNCTKLISDSCMLTTVPLKGGRYYIGSGETHSCGHFEITGYSENITNYEITSTTEGIDEFYITFADKSQSQEEINSDINVYFRYNDEAEGENRCSKSVTMVQTANYLDCARLKELLESYQKESLIAYTEEEEEVNILPLTGKHRTSANLFYSRGLLDYKIIEGESWLSVVGHVPDVQGGAFAEIKVKTTPGENCEFREAKLSISLNKEKAKEFGLCNCELTEIEIPIREVSNKCFEGISHKEITISYNITSDNENLGLAYESCLNKDETNIEFEEQIIPLKENHDDDNFTPLNSWFSVCPCLIGSGNKKTVMLYYKLTVNDTGKDRTVNFTYRREFIDKRVCSTEYEITQSKLENITCENAYRIYDGQIGAFYNINSANTDTERYALNYEGGNAISLASYKTDDKYAIQGAHLSGVVATDVDWIEFSDNGRTNVFNFNLLSNKNDNITPDYDGSTKSRSTNVTLFLMEKNESDEYVPIKDYQGNECEGLTFPICQKGFSGYCPTCSTIEKNEEDKDYVIVNYDGYGEPHVPYDESSPSSIEVPCFVGTETDIPLFECKLNEKVTSYGTINIRCFDLIVESDNEYVVKDSLHADLKENTLNEYIIRGKLKENKSTDDYLPVSIKLYFGKRNFLDDSVIKCENTTLTLGFLKIKK